LWGDTFPLVADLGLEQWECPNKRSG